jgi:hypothetical protein
MKKITAIIILAAIMSFALMLTVSAEEPAYYYEAQKAVIPVTFTGNIDDWADAVPLVINANNKVFQEYGRFQTDPRVATPEQLSCTYYIKWDETYLYIREERTDADGLNNPTVDPSGPWMGDGTAFFFADGIDLSRADIRWIPYTDTTAKKCAIWSQPVGDEVTNEWQCAGFKKGNVYTIELAMPWSVMGDQLTQAIKEGAIFRFCPIITSRDNDGQYGDWTEEVQINFYDGFIKFDLGNSESPDYHAGLRLVAANYQPPVAEAVEVEEHPAVVPDPNTPAIQPIRPIAPQTGDTAIFVFLAFAVMVVGAVAIKKVKVK